MNSVRRVSSSRVQWTTAPDGPQIHIRRHCGPQGGPSLRQLIGRPAPPLSTCGRAGTLRSFSTFRPWHLGHATVSSPKTNSSNTCSHFRHSYSYRGMAADLESLVQLLATLAVDFTRPQQDL